MKWTAAAFAGLAATAVADGAKPDAPAPGGCSASRDGKFQISIYSLGNAKRDLTKRACEGSTLVMTLKDGILKDAKDRTGYIASNYQFQFDAPPQANAIYTAGFSACNNGSLALGGSTVFYRCLSGEFYNLYDRHWAAQCEPIEMVASSCDGGTNTGGNGASQIQDGQPQAPSYAPPVTQIADGQPQAPSTLPVMPPPVSQIGDGQPQAPTNTAAPPPPVSQIGDGQPQAPTNTAAPPPVSQIGDGQPQAPTGTAPVVSQISDGQPQAPTGTTPVVAGADKLFPGAVAAVVAVFGAALVL